MRERLLILTDNYFPGFKTGGPSRNTVYLAKAMAPYYEVYVITEDRDKGETSTYANISANQWTDQGDYGKVNYVSPDQRTLAHMEQLILEVAPRHIYLNNVYSMPFTVYPLWLYRRGKIACSVTLGTNGMIAQLSLAIKPIKKALFFQCWRWLGLQNNVYFHLANKEESLDLVHVFPDAKNRIFVGSHLVETLSGNTKPIFKEKGAARFSYIGRVHPIKNLAWLLKELPRLKGNVILDVVGILDAPEYHQLCLQFIQQLPPHIKVVWHDQVSHDHVATFIQKGHALAHPSLFESFGFSIIEALGLGRPVIVSNQTPWKDLNSAKAGWSVDVKTKHEFIDKMQEVINWDQPTYDAWAKGAKGYFENYYHVDALVKGFLDHFNRIGTH